MTLNYQLTPWRIASVVVSWPAASQAGSRRNALAASTALARHRQELREVDEFLQQHAVLRERHA